MLALSPLVSQNTTLTPDRAATFTAKAATLRADAPAASPVLASAATAAADKVDSLIAHVRAGQNQQGLQILGQLLQSSKQIAAICDVQS